MTIADPEIQTPPAAAPAEPGPLHTRIIETFVSPGALFARFGSAAPWIGVLLVSVVVMAVTFALIPKDAFVEMMREQMASMPRQPGQPAPDPAVAATFGRVMGLFSAIAYPFIATVIVAGLLKLIFGAMLGGEATFQQYLGVYAHSFLILALGMVVTLPIIIVSGDMMRQLTPALLLPDLDRTGAAFRLLTQFGVFNLWQYAVIAIGAHTVNRGKVSAAAAWGAVAGLYLLTALLAAVPALLQARG